MNWDTVSFRLLRSLRRLSMSLEALLASVDAAFERPSLPRFSASLTFSRAAPKSDEREPGLVDAPWVDAFTISLRAALPRLLIGARSNERPNGHVNNEALREKFRVWQLARQTTAAGLRLRQMTRTSKNKSVYSIRCGRNRRHTNAFAFRI